MPRLKHFNGAIVNVPDEKAERLLAGSDFTLADKPAAKKAAASKTAAAKK